MSQLPTVTIAGATGNLGPAIVSALLETGVKLTILSRATSNSKIAPHPNQTIQSVDFESTESLTAALAGSEVVISTVSSTSIETQKVLIDAALAAGARRYITSEFGSDLANPSVADLPGIFQEKRTVQSYVEALARQHPSFTWTSVRNSAFFDWGIDVDFLINAKEHTATLYDGGDVPFSVTRLSTVGRTVASIVKNLDATANKAVYVHDAVVTQNQLIKAVKKIDGKEWKTETKSSADSEAWARAEFAKADDDSNKNAIGAMYGVIIASVWRDGYGGDFTGKVWNDKLGIPVLSEEEVDQVVAEIVSKP